MKFYINLEAKKIQHLNFTEIQLYKYKFTSQGEV